MQTRVRLSYFDQNESLAPQFPVDACVDLEVSAEDSQHLWYLLKLDSPLIYGGKEYMHALVASRWKGHPVIAKTPSSVFLLLVQESQLPIQSPITVASHPHVAWCTCEVFGA